MDFCQKFSENLDVIRGIGFRIRIQLEKANWTTKFYSWDFFAGQCYVRSLNDIKNWGRTFSKLIFHNNGFLVFVISSCLHSDTHLYEYKYYGKGVSYIVSQTKAMHFSQTTHTISQRNVTTVNDAWKAFWVTLPFFFSSHYWNLFVHWLHVPSSPAVF